MKVRFIQRQLNSDVYKRAVRQGLSDFQARLIAGRCNFMPENLEHIITPALKYIRPPSLLQDCEPAAGRIVQAVIHGETVGILTDYDVDGICSHVVIHDALIHYFGVDVSKVRSYIGHRIQDGYGVSEGLVDKILSEDTLPELVITADCGSSDELQIARLKTAGIDVVVTDHHAIPRQGVPASALATVNPTRKDCRYPDKTIAGCMVAWLVLCHVRNQLLAHGHLPENTPKLLGLLDFISLGTVADAVSLHSAVNRAVVNAGLRMMNRLARPCWQAIFSLLGRKNQPFTTQDLGFQIAPRINARSRMADPHTALRFVLSQSDRTASIYLSAMDSNNQARKQTEREMVAIANSQLQPLDSHQAALVAADPCFHPGVQGIVASRLVDAFGRPTVIFSNARNPEHFTGSARTIPQVNIRRALQHIEDHHPGLMVAFGGHRGAAGLTICRDQLEAFKRAFEAAVRDQIGVTELEPVIHTDGCLDGKVLKLETVREIKALEPYGRNFEEPVFEGYFQVGGLRRVGLDKIHLSMQLTLEQRTLKAIWFRAVENQNDPLPIKVGNTIHCAFRLDQNEFQGVKSLQLIIVHAAPA